MYLLGFDLALFGIRSAPRYVKTALVEVDDPRSGQRMIQKKVSRPAGVKWFSMHVQGWFLSYLCSAINLYV